MIEATKFPRRAAIFGASGGIGAAICRLLADQGCEVMAFSRGGDVPRHGAIQSFSFDLEDESSIIAAIADAGVASDPPDLVIAASGVLTLQGDEGECFGPERSLKSLDPAIMARIMQINAIGPAMIAKHVLPAMPRDAPWVFCAVSAKVGSISDNRLGGWYSYRASKAALNMLVKNFAIEMGRTHQQGIVVAMHPGTVDTPMSAPFQTNVPDGQLATRHQAACNVLGVLQKLGVEDSGKLLAWDGSEIAP